MVTVQWTYNFYIPNENDKYLKQIKQSESLNQNEKCSIDSLSAKALKKS